MTPVLVNDQTSTRVNILEPCLIPSDSSHLQRQLRLIFHAKYTNPETVFAVQRFVAFDIAMYA